MVDTGVSEKRRLSAMFSVRLSPAELEAVQAKANEHRESVSGYLRRLALREINAPLSRCRGCLIIGNPTLDCDLAPGHEGKHHTVLHSTFANSDVEWKHR